MAFTRFASTDSADLAALLNRLGDELTTDINARAAGSHTHTWAQVTGKPTTFPPSAHTHAWDAVTGKPTTFPPAAHSHAWDAVTGKPTTFPPSAHSHAVADVSGLGAALAAADPTFAWRDVSSLLENGWTGNLFVGRSANTVAWRGQVSAAAATAAAIYTIPAGYRVGVLASGGLYDYGTDLVWTQSTPPALRRVSYYLNRWSITGYSVGDVYTIGSQYLTRDSRPALEPGVPA